MPTLTYRYLGDALTVGEALGADSSGWPWRVEAITHEGDQTRVRLEPWPALSPGATEDEKAAYRVAMEVGAAYLQASRIAAAGRTPR